MKRAPRVGFLPLYLKLYDDSLPEMRARLEPWVESIAAGLVEERLDLVRASTCRVAAEFREAVRLFEAEDVDLVVTLHLAYSLSLEAVDALESCARPLLLLDTTPDRAFGRGTDPQRILDNHGIHGVQDLASVLRRRRVPFEIVAGHSSQLDFFPRAASVVRAALAARTLRGARALRIGESFRGMGDFLVPEAILQDALGISVTQGSPDDLASQVRSVTEDEIAAEVERDRSHYSIDAPSDVHRRSVRVGLGLRRLLDEGKYDAFSANFLAFDSAEGPVDTVPFLESSKAMARGVGYAGEGDVLTASLVAALSRGFGRTTFTEAFCPDWEGGSLFLSHMGEINPEVSAGRPWIHEKEFPWTGARNPAVIACAPAPGPAVLVNLAPGPEGSFRLIASRVEVLGDAEHPAMRREIRGWVRPAMALETFLEEYSRAGGTHHSALVLGDRSSATGAFARFAGIELVEL